MIDNHLEANLANDTQKASPPKPTLQFPIRAVDAGPRSFARRQPTLRSVRSDESLVSRITPTGSMDNGSRDNLSGWSANPDSLGAQGPPMATLNSVMFANQTVRAPSIRRTPSTSKPNSLWAKKPKHLQAARVLSSSPEPMPAAIPDPPASPTKIAAAAASAADQVIMVESMARLRPWNERPSTDEISQNLDRYFPDHDLDRPILDQVEEDEEGVSDYDLEGDVSQIEADTTTCSHSRGPSESSSISTFISNTTLNCAEPCSELCSEPGFMLTSTNDEGEEKMLDMTESEMAARRAHYKLRRVMNRKSIRIVVQEAQQRSQAAWVPPITPTFTPSATSAPVEHLASSESEDDSSDSDTSATTKPPRRTIPIRRRSTMLWGSRVAELPKNGSNRIRRRDRVRPSKWNDDYAFNGHNLHTLTTGLPVVLPAEMDTQSGYYYYWW